MLDTGPTCPFPLVSGLGLVWHVPAVNVHGLRPQLEILSLLHDNHRGASDDFIVLLGVRINATGPFHEIAPFLNYDWKTYG
jgi:hypothetical protein